MSQQNTQNENTTTENSPTVELPVTATTKDEASVEISSIASKSFDRFADISSSVQQTTPPETMLITSTTPLIASDINVNDTTESPVRTVISVENEVSEKGSSLVMNTSELTATPVSGHSSIDIQVGLTSPTTPNVPKERKRRIVIDDDDESPTFNPLRSSKKIRGKHRRNRNSLLVKKRKHQLLSPSDKVNENAVFTSPDGIVSITSNVLKYFI